MSSVEFRFDATVKGEKYAPSAVGCLFSDPSTSIVIYIYKVALIIIFNTEKIEFTSRSRGSLNPYRTPPRN